MIALITAGQTSELVNLIDVLKEEHEASQKARQLQIDLRKEARIPLDDSTNWSEVQELADELKLSVMNKKTISASNTARKIFERTQGNSLEPLPDFVPPVIAEGVKIRFKILSNSQMRRLSTEISDAWQRKRDAFIDGNTDKINDATDDIENGIIKTVCSTICEIQGIEGVTADNLKEFADALDCEGLLSMLYTVSRHFMDLPRKKALLCGALPPSI